MNGNEFKEIRTLVKFIMDEGYDRNDNGNDTRVIALLGSLSRNPNNEWHNKLFWRNVMPKVVERAFIGNPFEPYPMQQEFKEGIAIAFVGIHESYLREEFEASCKRTLNRQ